MVNEAFGKKISVEGHCKHLGIAIDGKLNFDEHVSHVTKNGIILVVSCIKWGISCLLLFHKTVAKPIFTNGLMNYGATAKTILYPIEKAQWWIIGAIFFWKQMKSLQNVYNKHIFLTIEVKYNVELICELMRQLRGNSRFDFETSNLIPPVINTRKRQRGLLKWTYNRTKLKPRSLENSIVKTYYWLRMLDLIPQKIKNITKNASENLIHNIAHTYLSNNTEVPNVYFWSPYRCLRHVFFSLFTV